MTKYALLSFIFAFNSALASTQLETQVATAASQAGDNEYTSQLNLAKEVENRINKSRRFGFVWCDVDLRQTFSPFYNINCVALPKNIKNN